MRFGHLLEFHKIPEWYTYYCLYNDHKQRIEEFQEHVQQNRCRKLKGYYTINKKGQIYCIDFIKNYKDDVKQANKKKGVKRKRRNSQEKISAKLDEEDPKIKSRANTLYSSLKFSKGQSKSLLNEELPTKEAKG
jgi:DNA-binding PadR family transcriptional regulator